MPDYTAEIKDIPELVADINERLKDNNSGSISAQDVRETMRNIAKSIRHIVASGTWEQQELKFINNIYARTVTDPSTQVRTGGVVIVESGIQFNNAPGNGALQVFPYPGPGNIDHADLFNLSEDVHPQYLDLAGTRSMQADLKIDNYSISSSGYAGHGISFEHGGADNETLVIGDETDIKFAADDTYMTTARSTAQAWISFSSVSGVVGETDTLNVHSSYNIAAVRRVRNGNAPYDPEPGMFKIYFKQNLFQSGDDYVAVGRSTGRTAHGAGQGGNFAITSVGIVDRQAEYCTFYVLDENGDYEDSYYNDLVIYGVPSGTNTANDPAVTIGYEPTP